MANLKLSPPWCTFFREIKALFENDPEVHVVYDEDAGIIKIYVEEAKKADALASLIPTRKMFGRVGVDIQVIPADGSHVSTDLPDSPDASMFETAFKGNSALSYAKTFPNLFGFSVTYVVFKPVIIQFYADDISDIHGLKSMLYADIAKDVFEDVHVNFCTDLVED